MMVQYGHGVGAGYKVACYNFNYKGYSFFAGYSIAGTVPVSDFTSCVDVSRENKSGIDIKLIKTRKICGTIALPEGATAPEAGIDITVAAENDNYLTSRLITIPEGENFAYYEIEVPVFVIPTLRVNAVSHNPNGYFYDVYDFVNVSETVYIPLGNKSPSSKYKVSYSLNSDYGYLSGGLYSLKGTTYSYDSASNVDVNVGDKENINMNLISGSRTIKGIISLPEGEKAPKGGLLARILATNKLISDSPYTFVKIPEGAEKAEFTIMVPPLADYKIEYELYQDTNTGYVSYGFYSKKGIKGNAADATSFSTLYENADGIIITLLPGVSVSGTIFIPEGYRNWEKDLDVVVSFSNDNYRIGSNATIEKGNSYVEYKMFVPKNSEYVVGYEFVSNTEKYSRFGYYNDWYTTTSYREDARTINIGSDPVTGIDVRLRDASYIVSGLISLPNGAGSNTYSIPVPLLDDYYYLYYLLSSEKYMDEYENKGYYSKSGTQSNADLITGVEISYPGDRNINFTILPKPSMPTIPSTPSTPPSSGGGKNPLENGSKQSSAGGGSITNLPVQNPELSTGAGKLSYVGVSELKSALNVSIVKDEQIVRIEKAVQTIISSKTTNEAEALEVSTNILEALAELNTAMNKTSDQLIKKRIVDKYSQLIAAADDTVNTIKNSEKLAETVNKVVERSSTIINQTVGSDLNEQKQQLLKNIGELVKKATKILENETISLQGNSDIARVTLSNIEVNSIVSKVDAIQKINECIEKNLGNNLPLFDNEKKFTFEILKNVAAKEMQIEMPSNLIEKLKSKDLTCLNINSEVAIVSIPFKALSTTEIAMITLTVKSVKSSELPSELITKVSGAKIYGFDFEVSKTSGVKEKLSSLNSEIEIMVPFTLENDDDPEKIVVYQLNTESKLTNVNARYDSQTKALSFKTNSLSKFAVKYNPVTFGDIGNFTWAQKAIEVMASKGFILGKGSGQFDPDANITRAEFAAIIVNTFGIYDEKSKCTLSDVKEDNWFYASVASAVKAGIINGYTDSTFRPNAPITRQDIAAILGNLMKKYKGINTEGLDTKLAFADSSSIAGYAKEGIELATKYNIITGMPGNNFAPKQNATRAQAAVVIYKLLSLK